MPNLILQIDDISMVKKYMNSSNNIVVVYFYGSTTDDKYNRLEKINTIFPNDLPEDVYISFVKCNLTGRCANITKEHKNHKLLRHDQKILIKHKNKFMVCKNASDKIDQMITNLNAEKSIETRSSKQNMDFFE